MGKAKALPQPYFTGEGRVAVMLGAVLSTPKGSGCPRDHGLPQPVAPSAGTALPRLQKQLFPAAESHGLGLFFLFTFVPRGRNGVSLPLPAGRPGPAGLGAGCAAEGPCHLPAGEPGPGVPLVTCLWLSPRQLPPARGPLRLGHGLGMSCAGALLPDSGPLGAAVAAGRFLG